VLETLTRRSPADTSAPRARNVAQLAVDDRDPRAARHGAGSRCASGAARASPSTVDGDGPRARHAREESSRGPSPRRARGAAGRLAAWSRAPGRSHVRRRRRYSCRRAPHPRSARASRRRPSPRSTARRARAPRLAPAATRGGRRRRLRGLFGVSSPSSSRPSPVATVGTSVTSWPAARSRSSNKEPRRRSAPGRRRARPGHPSSSPSAACAARADVAEALAVLARDVELDDHRWASSWIAPWRSPPPELIATEDERREQRIRRRRVGRIAAVGDIALSIWASVDHASSRRLTSSMPGIHERRCCTGGAAAGTRVRRRHVRSLVGHTLCQACSSASSSMSPPSSSSPRPRPRLVGSTPRLRGGLRHPLELVRSSGSCSAGSSSTYSIIGTVGFGTVRRRETGATVGARPSSRPARVRAIARRARRSRPSARTSASPAPRASGDGSPRAGGAVRTC